MKLEGDFCTTSFADEASMFQLQLAAELMLIVHIFLWQLLAMPELFKWMVQMF